MIRSIQDCSSENIKEFPARVLHIGTTPPPVGGMAINVERYLASRVADEFNVKQLSADPLNKLAYDGLRRTVLNYLNPLVLIILTAVNIIKFQPAIVHIRTNSFAGFYEKSLVALIARLFGRQVVMHVEGGAFGEFYKRSPGLFRRLIGALLSMNHCVIVLSEKMRELMIALGVDHDAIEVINNAVYLPEHTVFDNRSSTCDNTEMKIIFLNRVIAEKGIVELIEAAKLLASGTSAAFKCLIYGPETNETEVFRKLITDHGLDGLCQGNGVAWLTPFYGFVTTRAVDLPPDPGEECNSCVDARWWWPSPPSP